MLNSYFKLFICIADNGTGIEKILNKESLFPFLQQKKKEQA